MFSKGFRSGHTYWNPYDICTKQNALYIRVGLSLWEQGSSGVFLTWKLRSAVYTSESSSAIENFMGSMQTRRSPVWPVLARFGCRSGSRSGLGLGLGLESGVGLGLRPYLVPNRNQNTWPAYQPKYHFSQIAMGPLTFVQTTRYLVRIRDSFGVKPRFILFLVVPNTFLTLTSCVCSSHWTVLSTRRHPA